MIYKIKSLTNLDRYVIFSISFTIFYTAMEFIFSTLTGVSHDVLTEWVYKFFAGEVVVCALIKIFKIVPINNVKNKLTEAIGTLLESESEEVDS
jgi:hypothetical protein